MRPSGPKSKLGMQAATGPSHTPSTSQALHPTMVPSPPLGDRVSTSTSTMLWNAGDPKTGESRGLYCDHAADGGLVVIFSPVPTGKQVI